MFGYDHTSPAARFVSDTPPGRLIERSNTTFDVSSTAPKLYRCVETVGTPPVGDGFNAKVTCAPTPADDELAVAVPDTPATGCETSANDTATEFEPVVLESNRSVVPAAAVDVVEALTPQIRTSRTSAVTVVTVGATCEVDDVFAAEANTSTGVVGSTPV